MTILTKFTIVYNEPGSSSLWNSEFALSQITFKAMHGWDLGNPAWSIIGSLIKIIRLIPILGQVSVTCATTWTVWKLLMENINFLKLWQFVWGIIIFMIKLDTLGSCMFWLVQIWDPLAKMVELWSVSFHRGLSIVQLAITPMLYFICICFQGRVTIWERSVFR